MDFDKLNLNLRYVVQSNEKVVKASGEHSKYTHPTCTMSKNK